VERVLKAEVVVYDKFLTGDFVGYVVLAKDGEEHDSCWGIDDVKYAISSAKEYVDWYIQKSVGAVDNTAEFLK
jgi:hypothetical protein